MWNFIERIDGYNLTEDTYRWVRVSKDSEWEPAFIQKVDTYDKLVYTLCGNDMEEYLTDCYEWGPIIEHSGYRTLKTSIRCLTGFK